MNHPDAAFTWWAALNHGGLLIAPARLREFFADDLPHLSYRQADQLRRAVLRFLNGDSLALAGLLDTVFEQVLGLDFRWWDKGSRVGAEWSHKLVTGESLRPQRVCQVPDGLTLPVFVADGVTRLGVGQGRRAVARVVEWQRKIGRPLALLTNGRQWRLIHAGSDYDAWCEWDSERWFEQGEPGLQVTALRHLLGVAALQGAPPCLTAAIQATRAGQAELSTELGERVRQAVELVIRACAPRIDRLLVEHPEITPQHVYIAANRIIMRCVIVLFAEARELLPVDNPIYHDAYGLNGLREQLERQGGARAPERLRDRLSAWPRLLALFHLLYHGSTHERLPIPTYGGRLFAPGHLAARDPVRRALTALEDTRTGPSDAAVYRLLQLLTRSRVKIRQGQRSIWVEAPVDFSDLSSEYIGILYQGLLDFELRRAAADEPLLFLNLGDQPLLPLTRLEGMTNTALAALVEKLNASSKPGVASDDSEDAAEAEESEAEDGQADEGAEPDEATEEDAPADMDEEEDDLTAVVRAQAQAWAARAVVVGNLVNRPHGKLTARDRAQYEAQVQAMARKLISRVVLPGEWFLVRWGGTRKGSGTFYTRPQLGVPLVRRTLEPLCYEPSPGPTRSAAPRGNDSPDALRPVEHAEESTERQERHDDGDRRHETQLIPKLPEVILALKMCDSAMGSGSLLAAALRYLTDALFESLYYHGRIAAHGEGGVARLADGQLTNDLITESLSVPPDHPDFDDRLRARLKRYVVERCLYGVDLDPLAVELARLSLWIETMDRSLPFGFLDHKLKCGNALVGCWLDRFQDYPVMAWERDGGDQNHDRFVRHYYDKTITHGKRQGQTERSGDRWTAEIKRIKTEVVRPQMQVWIEALGTQMMRFGEEALSANQLHSAALATFEQLHDLPVHDSAERARRYRELLDDPAWRQLKRAFDTWCAVWFWPGDQLAHAPTPANWEQLPPETAAIVDAVAAEQRFFHWELEFPDVFNPQRAGFDALIKNPPWDILKPKSQEFFSNIDPLYRTYTKQDALRTQTTLFEADATVEAQWLQYNANFRAMSNWSKYAALPFGDADGASFSFSRRRSDNTRLHRMWATQRRKRTGFADKAHPFQQQGSADLNAYKMFLEQCYVLARDGGYLGLIVPSGLSSDKGTGDLRELFLDRSGWEWLFGFENKNGIFDIHRSFKFYATIMHKGARTEAIRAAFMRHDLSDWAEAEQHVLAYPRSRIEQFSPHTKAILEIRSEQDLRVLEKLYSNSVLLGDTSENGWGIQYAREFDMTNDSKLFPPRPKWEQKGYRADEYGHWLKGKWRPVSGDTHILARARGTILSADGGWVISAEDVADVALPFYVGKMVGQFDFSEKTWQSGYGRSSIWKTETYPKTLGPDYLMSLDTYANSKYPDSFGKVAFVDITTAVHFRTAFSAFVPNFPCSNGVPTLHTPNRWKTNLVGAFNSFGFDFAARRKIGYLHLNYFTIEELPLPTPQVSSIVHPIVRALSWTHSRFSEQWLGDGIERRIGWRNRWAVSMHERLRLRCILDAIFSELYGLTIDNVEWIMRDSDHPASQTVDRSFTRTLDPKGFWRVDKALDPELRHTVLSLVAFHDLQARGLDAFLNQNDGDGWQLPATLRLADYGLGHDDRARQPQPVASRLGPRFLPWQLEGTPEQSWAECERHAENLRLLLGDLMDTEQGRGAMVVREERLPYAPEDETNNRARQMRIDFD